MNCPNCRVECADGALECSSCGLLFAKWRERQEREKIEAAAALALSETRSQAPSNLWTGRAVAVGLVAAWMLGLAVFYWIKMSRVPPAAPKAGFIKVRDLRTGEVRFVKLAEPAPADAAAPSTE